MPTTPAILPFTFGDWTPPPALARLEGSGLAWRPQIADDGAARLISQFQEKPRFVAFLKALLAALQEEEDGHWQVLIGIWLPTAEGVQLDGLGVLLDLERAGWSDDTYRLYLGAQVLVLGSDGSAKSFVDILRAIGVTLSTTRIARSGRAETSVVLGELLADEIVGADVYAMLARAKSGGVRLLVEFPVVDVDDTFAANIDDTEGYDERRGAADDALTIGGHAADAMFTTEAA